MPERRLVVQEAEGALLISFRDQAVLDTVTVDAIGGELSGLIDAQHQRNLVLDLSNVSFVSSPALSMLLHLRRKADEAGGEVVLCQLRPEIARLLRMTTLDKVFHFFETPTAALAHFTQ
jgi:anti-anti-sigma factor